MKKDLEIYILFKLKKVISILKLVQTTKQYLILKVSITNTIEENLPQNRDNFLN